MNRRILYTVEKIKTLKLKKELEQWQMEALVKAENVKTEEDILEAIEDMGIAQGIMNCLNTLELFTEEESKSAIEKQQDIAEEIEKSAKRLADQ